MRREPRVRGSLRIHHNKKTPLVAFELRGALLSRTDGQKHGLAPLTFSTRAIHDRIDIVIPRDILDHRRQAIADKTGQLNLLIIHEPIDLWKRGFDRAQSYCRDRRRCWRNPVSDASSERDGSFVQCSLQRNPDQQCKARKKDDQSTNSKR